MPGKYFWSLTFSLADVLKLQQHLFIHLLLTALHVLMTIVQTSLDQL